MNIRRKKYSNILTWLICLLFALPAYSWVVEMGFEDGVVGEKVIGFDDAAGHTYQNSDITFSGAGSAQLNIEANAEGFGTWGGRKQYPTSLGEGDEIWIKLNTYIPNSFDYSTNFALKFLRTLVSSDTNSPLGHIDIYINNDGTYKYQNELYTTSKLNLKEATVTGSFMLGETLAGQTSGAQAIVTKVKKNSELVFTYANGSKIFQRHETIIGLGSGGTAQLDRVESNSVTNFGANTPVEKDVWETYVFHIRYSATNPLVEFYKHVGGHIDSNKKRVGGGMTRIFHDTTDFTLQNNTNLATTFLLFTYWNGSSPKTQHMYVDDLWLGTTKPDIIIVTQPLPPILN